MSDVKEACLLGDTCCCMVISCDQKWRKLLEPWDRTALPVAPAPARKQHASWSAPLPHLPNFAAAFYHKLCKLRASESRLCDGRRSANEHKGRLTRNLCACFGDQVMLPLLPWRVQAINAEMPTPYRLAPLRLGTELVFITILRKAAVHSCSAFYQAANQAHVDVTHQAQGQISEPEWPTWQLHSANFGRKQSHCRNRAGAAFAKQYYIA